MCQITKLIKKCLSIVQRDIDFTVKKICEYGRHR